MTVFLTFLLTLASVHGAVTDNKSDLIIPEGETCTKFGTYTYSNSVEIYGRLVVPPYTGWPGTGTLKLVAPTIIVHPGGVIDADYAGYPPGQGPGVGISPPGCAGSGAGYGDPGGKGYGPGAKGGPPYGYPSGAVHIGSGGLSTETAAGGRGGGAIHLRGSQSITISGTITAAGQHGENAPSGYAAGGGSGGAILIDASGAHVAIDGLVSSKGGNGGDGKFGGGGGAGSRIRVLRGPEPELSSAEIRCMWGKAGASDVMDYPPERGSGGSGWTPERQPTYTPPSVSQIEPEPPHSGTIKIWYTLWDAEADMCSLAVEYSTDGGISFKPASLSPVWYGKWRNGIWDPYYPEYGTEERRPYRADWRSSILWDSLKDIGPTQLGGIRIRITPDDGFDEPGIPDTSGSFTVDNRSLTPGPPKIEYWGPDFVGLSIDRGGIYPPAEFAIWNATDQKYVDADGLSVSDTPVWRTEFGWGVVRVEGLSTATTYSFRVKARDLQIGLQTELGPTSAATTTEAAAFDSVESHGIIFSLVLDKTVYQFAEPVNFQFMVTNTTSAPFFVDFPCAHQLDYLVYKGEELIYQFDTGFCLTMVTSLDLEPGETYVYSMTWYQTRNVRGDGIAWPGQYGMTAYLVPASWWTGWPDDGMAYGNPLGSWPNWPYPIPSPAVGFEILDPLRERIGGRLPADATLTKEGSPFYVPSDLIVPQGVTLTIEPGVELLFDYREGSQNWSWSDRGAGLFVSGTLVARGTPQDPIVFRSSRSAHPTSADWKGISFSGTATNVVFDPETGHYLEGCIMEHCLIEHAVTAFQMNISSPLISNCIIRNNGDPMGIPRYLIHGDAPQALFLNNSIVRNHGWISGDFTFVNCILWRNVNLKLEGVSARYCSIEGGYRGEGNINADPLFFDFAGGDHHLLPGSPCIDAGTTDVQGIPDLDMDGDPRVSGASVDIGADEYADNDDDGILDRLEVFYFGSLCFGPDDDPDDDGLTISEELEGGTNPAKSDTDADGVSDGKELFTGTDPLDPGSCFKILVLEPGEFMTRLCWNSEPGRCYRVFVSEDMQDWSCVRDAFTALATTSMFIESYGDPIRRRFYKIELLP